jgi:NAD(P)-dependent dehydrogenase (short-subunit alcohol dehydrogenase family)
MTKQRVAVVTGASSGIGKETAKALAGQGWRVIGIGRDKNRSLAAEAEIRQAAHGVQVDMLRADLARLNEAQRVAEEVAALTDRIDVLVNNAGVMCREQVITPEGLVENFAGNHLGPFLLTLRLLPLLQAAAKDAPPGSVRIINTSSDASEMTKGLPWEDLQLKENFDPGASYCNTKLANVMFARGLAKRLGADGIVAHSMHPGVVASNFVSHASERTAAYISTLQAQSEAEGADTLIWLAVDDAPGQSNGGYFYQRKPRAMNPFAEDEANVDRLWTESEKMLAAAGFA